MPAQALEAKEAHALEAKQQLHDLKRTTPYQIVIHNILGCSSRRFVYGAAACIIQASLHMVFK